jgi:hypothetical protein
VHPGGSTRPARQGNFFPCPRLRQGIASNPPQCLRNRTGLPLVIQVIQPSFCSFVPGLVPGTHGNRQGGWCPWMAGSEPGHGRKANRLSGSEHQRWFLAAGSVVTVTLGLGQRHRAVPAFDAQTSLLRDRSRESNCAHQALLRFDSPWPPDPRSLRAGRKIGSTPEIVDLMTNNARQINPLRSRYPALSGKVLREAGRPLRERAGRESPGHDASPSLESPTVKAGKTGRIVERVREIAREIIDKAGRIRHLGDGASLYEQGALRRCARGGIRLTGW